MDLTWAEVATTVVAGLGGMLGVYVMEDVLRMLRRRGICPERWNRDRQRVQAIPEAAAAAPADHDRDETAELPVAALSSPSRAAGPGTEMAMASNRGPGGTAGE